MDSEPSLAFGPFRLDPHSRSLTRDGAPVVLGERAFDVLAVLAAADGQLVTKDVLLDRVWSRVAVEENNLHAQISALRKALGADAIATIPGRGYRLAVASSGSGLPTESGEAQGNPAIVVLPFACLAADVALEYFAAAIAGDITTALARIRSVVVVVPPSDVPVAPGNAGAKHAAHRVGARYILEGTVQGSAGQVRINVRLVDAESGVQLWAELFDGTFEDGFGLQDRVTSRVVAAITPCIVTAEMRRVQLGVARKPRPYDLLLQGLAQHATRSRSGMEHALRLLRRAIELDPSYALAHAHLASLQWLMVSQHWRDVDDPEVSDLLAIVETALAIGCDDPDVLLLVSPAVSTRGGDLDGGIALLDRSLALNPNSAAAHRILGVLHSYAGETDIAFASIARADQLNPLDHGVVNDLGYLIGQFCVSDYERAAQASSRLVNLQPKLIPTLRWRAASLGMLGRTEEGRKLVKRILDLSPNFSVARMRRFNEHDQNGIMKNAPAAEAFYEGLRRSGAPED